MKKILSILLAFLMLFAILSACGSTDDKDTAVLKTEEFTYWLSVGESSLYYTQYQDNPVMQYIMNNMTFKNKDGEDTKISLKFETPASGREVDTYNLMISTDSLLDIMCMNFGMPVEDMYEAGQILDLTYYVENHMPNFKAYVDAHPELYPYLTKVVDGERKFLNIPGALDQANIYDQFCGVCYRRDWIVKYGSPPAELWSLDANNNKVFAPNPNAGVPFSFRYTLDKDGNSIDTTELTDNVDSESWVDNIIFPSGNADPIYISDWEWMMEIFARAIADQGINDGYVMSLYYPGYIQTGDITCGFGGKGPYFQIDRDTGRATFGAAEEGFKSYLQCMNQWYQNGWIDKEFQDKNDMFFQIDETKIYQGKIALWMGAAAHVGSRIRSDVQPLTDGAMVFGAPQPINDIYGHDSTKFVQPYDMFGGGDLLGGGVCVTNKAKDKDITVLMGFLDFFFSEEGSMLKTMGFSKEQLEQFPSELYDKHGLSEGAYSKTADGKFMFDPIMEMDDGGIRSVMSANRIPGLTRNSVIQYNYTPTYIHSRENWVKYPATGFLGGMFRGQMMPDEQRVMEQVGTVLEREYMHIEVPKFITGDKNFEGDYDTFLNNLEKRNYHRVVEALNATIDRLK
ncbi:MAG: hypothetical protein FWG36_03310 [Oscillospiraceae bacterium]|nr:hypothetical protein [Oscillospiraceae bacterium]